MRGLHAPNSDNCQLIGSHSTARDKSLSNKRDFEDGYSDSGSNDNLCPLVRGI